MPDGAEALQQLLTRLGPDSSLASESLPRLSDILVQSSKLPSTTTDGSPPAADGTPSSFSGTTGRPKFKRSRAGCLHCRRRKVKCDMVQPTCLKCVALGKPCEYPAPPASERKRKRRKVDDGADTDEETQERDEAAEAEEALRRDPMGCLRRLEALLGKRLIGQLLAAAPPLSTLDVPPQPSQPAPMPAFPPVNPTLSPLRNLPAALQTSPESSTSAFSPPHPSPARMPVFPPPPPPQHPPPTFQYAQPMFEPLRLTPTPPPPPSFGPSETDALALLNLANSPGWVAFGAQPAASTPAAVPANPRPQTAGLPPPQLQPPPPPPIQIPPAHFVEDDQSAEQRETQEDVLSILNSAIDEHFASQSQPAAQPATSSRGATPLTSLALSFPSRMQQSPALTPASFASVLHTPSAIASFFPTPQARFLLHHLLSQSSRLCIAVDEPSRPRNPFLAVVVPLALTGARTPASDALRCGLLAISATHMHFLQFEQQQFRGAKRLLDGPPKEDDANGRLSKRLKRAAMDHTLVLLSSQPTTNDVDFILAVIIAFLKDDVLGADRAWRGTVQLGLSIMSKLGGPEAMLSAPGLGHQQLFTRRVFLEELAAHEVFGCLGTGDAPRLLGAWQPWWYDAADASREEWEYESFERVFGMSRPMLDVIARACHLYARKAKLGQAIPLADDDAELVLRSLPSSSSRDAFRQLRQDALAMITELRVLQSSISSTPRHERVQCGDYIYRRTMLVFMYRDVFDIPRDSEDVQRGCRAILELCAEASTSMQMGIMLLQPFIIAGVNIQGAEDRRWLLSLFASIRDSYCSDLISTERIVREVWRRQDGNLAGQDFRVVSRDLGLDLLIV